jgi:hypothetical protein
MISFTVIVAHDNAGDRQRGPHVAGESVAGKIAFAVILEPLLYVGVAIG